MSAFERFDLNANVASPREIARRWRQFHRDVRRASSSRSARILGPLLGDDTRRRRVAERFRPEPTVVRATSPSAVDAFPINYMPPAPRTAVSSVELPGIVGHVVVDPKDPSTVFERFRDALEGSATWILISDDPDDSSRHATAEVLLAHRHGADVVFADEEGDVRTIPILKPREVGPHTLLSYNVVGRPALLRRERVARAGGLRPEARGAAEHDLYLRLMESGAVFRHVPVVLRGRSSAERHDASLSADTRFTVADALKRRGIRARVTSGATSSVVTWSPLLEPWPSIDIVIPTRDRVDLLRRCIESVQESTYPNFTITILNNGSIEQSTLDYLAATPHRVLDCPGPFNYAAIINKGIAACEADFIVTLNNDTEVRTVDWLEQLVGVASLDDVSVVGATLLDRDDHHEHDGIIIAPYPQHLRRHLNYLIDDDFVHARRDVAAVTGAVQMISRRLYLELDGMDENLAVVMNDVDLCLRSHVEGRHVVMVPDVKLSHFAGSSRGRLDPLADRNYFVRRWDVLGSFHDPYFPESMRLLGNSMHYRASASD